MQTAPVAPPPGQPAAAPRTSMVVGQVVDGATGAPIGDAIVRLSASRVADPTAPRDRVMADGEGRFFFSELPAGAYALQAAKDGYVPGQFGQRDPRGQSQTLTLAANERVTDVRIRLWKYAAIAGRVVDEAGEPVVGVAVRALRKDVIAGRIQFGSTEIAPEFVPSTLTDDRGMFRLSQLTPGTYAVAVPSTQSTLPASVLEGTNTTLRGDLFMSGITELAPLGQPRTQQFGERR